MSNQKGEFIAEFVIIVILVLIGWAYTSWASSKHDKEFETPCVNRGGHVVKEGRAFLGVPDTKFNKGIHSLCVDDKGRILE